jgi:hypothetical protein
MQFIVIGSETCGMDDVQPETLHRLAELGLAKYESAGWTLTKAGLKLLTPLLDGDEIEPLSGV